MSEPTITEKSIASLFPTGEIAWSGMIDGTMREFSDGLALQMERDKQNGENIRNDFFPDTTTFLKEWEYTFRLPTGAPLTNEQRTKRLETAWVKNPPAAYSFTNEIYALSGFDIIARPLLPSEDPRIIASSGDTVQEFISVCGVMRCGQLTESSRCGAFIEIPGTAEVQIFANGRPGEVVKNYISVCGAMRCGQLSESSRCGNFEGSRILPPEITIPDDEWTWPLIYVLERSDGEFAQIPIELKEDYECLTYKIKPLFMWALSRVEYV